MSVASETWVEPGRGGGLLSIFKWRYLLKLLIRKELRVRYRGSVLGLLWSYVKPAVQFVVFYFAVGKFLGMERNIENFAVYLFSGVVVINFFSEAFGNATRSVVGNAALVKKIYLPRELFPVASLWVAMVHFLPQIIVLVVGAVLSGWVPTLGGLVAGFLGFVIIALFSLGLGLFFAAFDVLYRDAENLVDLILMVATWVAPVLYHWTNVSEFFGQGLVWTVYQLNPLTTSVELFHYCFWASTITTTEALPPNFGALLAGSGLIVVLILAIGQLTFRKLDGRFAQEL